MKEKRIKGAVVLKILTNTEGMQRPNRSHASGTSPAMEISRLGEAMGTSGTKTIRIRYYRFITAMLAGCIVTNSAWSLDENGKPRQNPAVEPKPAICIFPTAKVGISMGELPHWTIEKRDINIDPGILLSSAMQERHGRDFT